MVRRSICKNPASCECKDGIKTDYDEYNEKAQNKWQLLIDSGFFNLQLM